MSSNSQIIETFFDRFDERMQAVPGVIAETATEYYKQAMINKSWDGSPWPPYGNPSKEPSRGSLLMRTNNLFSTIRPSVVEEGKVIISAGGAKVPYARVHNEGLRVRGVQNVRAHNRRRPGGLRSVQVQAHTRKVDFQMPRRQFMGFTQELKQSIESRIAQL